MSKIVLTDVVAGYKAAETLNNNNQVIEDAIENTLSRDGTGPNYMAANLDMNSYRIINLPNAVNNQEPITLAQAASIVGITTPLTQEAVGTVLYPRTPAEFTAGVTPTDYAYPPGDVRRYGAVGDGVADDTAEIQVALNSGHKRIVGDPTHTYLVSHSATTTINGVVYRYALTVPAGVSFDLNGATIKLAASQNTSLIALLADDAAVLNGTLDSNRSNQTSPATGEMAGVIAYDVDRVRVENVRAINNRQYAGRFLNCRASRFVGLHCADSYGDGWSFGTSGAVTLELIESFVDEIYAENCEGTYSGLQGNGAIFTAIRCEIGRVYIKDCRGSLKVQNTTADSIFSSLEFDGDDQTYGGVNSGIHIQGANGSSVYPTRCQFDQIVCRKAYGNGLAITDIGSIQVGSYSGLDNGSGSGATGSDQNDVEINLSNSTAAKNLQIGRIFVDNPDERGVRIQGSGNCQIGDITVRNPTGPAVQDTSSGRLQIRSILALDDQGAATMTYAFQSTGTATGRIESIETNLTHSTSQSRVIIASGNYNLEIGSIRLGSSDTLEGVAQLTNAATSTSVTCGHVWRAYVGGSSEYFHPIILVMPWDTSARALSGQFGATVTDGSSGTGLSLKHPSAGASDYVLWKVVGWRVVSQASS